MTTQPPPYESIVDAVQKALPRASGFYGELIRQDARQALDVVLSQVADLLAMNEDCPLGAECAHPTEWACASEFIRALVDGAQSFVNNGFDKICNHQGCVGPCDHPSAHPSLSDDPAQTWPCQGRSSGDCQHESCRPAAPFSADNAQPEWHGGPTGFAPKPSWLDASAAPQPNDPAQSQPDH